MSGDGGPVIRDPSREQRMEERRRARQRARRMNAVRGTVAYACLMLWFAMFAVLVVSLWTGEWGHAFAMLIGILLWAIPMILAFIWYG